MFLRMIANSPDIAIPLSAMEVDTKAMLYVQSVQTINKAMPSQELFVTGGQRLSQNSELRTDSRFGSPASSVVQSREPFHCMTEIISLDGTAQTFSITLWLTIETFTGENA